MSIPNPDSAKDFELLFLTLPDMICIFGLDGAFTLVNPACPALLGFAAEEMPGRFFLEFVHPHDLRQSALALRRLSSGEPSVLWHNRYACKDGTYKRLQWHATADLERRQIHAVGRDVSDLNVNEDLLGDSELKSVGTVEHALEGILRTAPSGQIMMANPAAVKMLGYESDEELMSWDIDVDQAMYVYPEDRNIVLDYLEREGVVHIECEIYRKNGTAIWVEMKARAIRHSSGALAYHEKLLRDITAEKQMEEAVRISDLKYRTMVENAPFGVYRSNLEGRFLDVNHALVAMLGYESREEVMKLSIDADVYLDPSLRSKLIERYGNVERIEGALVEWKHKDGTPFTVRLSARTIRDSYGVLEGFEVIAEDIEVLQASRA